MLRKSGIGGRFCEAFRRHLSAEEHEGRRIAALVHASNAPQEDEMITRLDLAARRAFKSGKCAVEDWRATVAIGETHALPFIFTATCKSLGEFLLVRGQHGYAVTRGLFEC